MSNPLTPTAVPLKTMKFRGDLFVEGSLPKPGTFRWTEYRRALFTEALKEGLLTEQKLRSDYGVTSKDLASPLSAAKNTQAKKPKREPEPKPPPKRPRSVVKLEGLPVPKTGKLNFLELEVDLDTGQARTNGAPFDPEPKEFLLFVLLLSRKREATSRKQIASTLQDAGYPVLLGHVDAVIDGLRKKLGRRANYLGARRGAGYFIRNPNSL